jgi:cold-inducible RNA-binding protein
MNKNLYVGNLTENITEQILRDNFLDVGPVASVTVIKDRFTGRSKGFGFVEMETEEGAQKAIERFNRGNLDGMSIVVSEAREKKDTDSRRRSPDRQRFGGGGGGYRGGGGGRRY